MVSFHRKKTHPLKKNETNKNREFMKNKTVRKWKRWNDVESSILDTENDQRKERKNNQENKKKEINNDKMKKGGDGLESILKSSLEKEIWKIINNDQSEDQDLDKAVQQIQQMIFSKLFLSETLNSKVGGNQTLIVKEYEIVPEYSSKRIPKLSDANSSSSSSSKALEVNEHIDYIKKADHDLFNLLNIGTEKQKEHINVVDVNDYFNEMEPGENLEIDKDDIDQDLDSDSKENKKLSWKLHVPEDERSGISDVLRSTVSVDKPLILPNLQELLEKNKRIDNYKMNIASDLELYDSDLADPGFFSNENSLLFKIAGIGLKYYLTNLELET